MLRRATEVYRSEGVLALARRMFRLGRVRFSRRFLNPLCTLTYDLSHGEGVNVMTEDWDNLIILDACRYDFFEAECEFQGQLESRVSRGAMSWEFMMENFVGRNLHDTVYVTSNPFVSRLDDVFHATVDEPLTKAWEDKYGTVMPESMTDAAIRSAERFPRKRLIVHYMQPHLPPIGAVADDIKERVELSGLDRGMAGASGSPDGDGLTLYAAYRNGQISLDTVEAAYRESLSVALDSVEGLLDRLDGKSVITSDHGELLGERPCLLYPSSFGHDNLPRNETLCRVPWFIVEGEQRRQVVEEPPVTEETMDRGVAEQRLEQLGYKM